MTGDPDKEYGTNKPRPTGRVQERSKGDTACLSTSHNPSCWHASWLSDACTTRKDSELEWLVKDHPETNAITIKPDLVNHAAEQFSWVSLPYCSPPRCHFPIKYLALPAHVSPQTIHSWVLDKSPVSGPGRGPPSCNTWTSPDGQYQNQINYILCRQRWRSSIQSAKTRPGADCGSDHELLIAKFRLKLKKVGKTTRSFKET